MVGIRRSGCRGRCDGSSTGKFTPARFCFTRCHFHFTRFCRFCRFRLTRSCFRFPRCGLGFTRRRLDFTRRCLDFTRCGLGFTSGCYWRGQWRLSIRRARLARLAAFSAEFMAETRTLLAHSWGYLRRIHPRCESHQPSHKEPELLWPKVKKSDKKWLKATSPLILSLNFCDQKWKKKWQQMCETNPLILSLNCCDQKWKESDKKCVKATNPLIQSPHFCDKKWKKSDQKCVKATNPLIASLHFCDQKWP
jgi:hypothetical protein